MGYKDLHEDPFDETTIAKLEIFEDYAQAWLPTFIMQKVSQIRIYDFFAGTGYDKNGVPGSPIRILRKILEQCGYLKENKVKVGLYLNEFEPLKKEQRKFALLKAACSEFLSNNNELESLVEVEYWNEDFETLFSKLLPGIRQSPSLVYLDQNGIKFLSEKYFLELEQTNQTDFLYFVSASYFWRFGDSKEFKVHLNIDMQAAKKDPFKFIHRNIIDQLRDKLPDKTFLKLYPFSLKKGSNIHGIIFGASHPRAVDKFLSIAWKRNEVNGEANFDIDDDSKKAQLDMFKDKKLTKIEEFNQRLKKEIFYRRVTNNFELLQFAFNEGHNPKHAADVVKTLKKDGKIFFEGISPLVTYENVYKTKKKVEFKILKDEDIKD